MQHFTRFIFFSLAFLFLHNLQAHLSTHRADLDQVRQHLKTGQEFVTQNPVNTLNQKPEILNALEELGRLVTLAAR